MSKTGKVIKVAAIGAASIAVIGFIAGTDSTATVVHHGATAFGWGGGVEVASVPDVVAGFRAGYSGTRGSFQTLTSAPPATTAPKAQANKTVVKVPNCSAAQKKAAKAEAAKHPKSKALWACA